VHARLTRRELVRAGALGATATLAGVGGYLLSRGGGSSHPAGSAPAGLERLRVGPRGTGLVGAASGAPFVAWGFNWGGPGDYDDLGLVRERFSQMRSFGANTVRLHLQFGDVMTSPTQPSRAALDHLSAIVSLAESERLYLDISGNEVWVPGGAPAWYDNLGESARWDAQAAYWSALAEACAGSAAVACYDLLSEPAVGDGLPRGGWYTGRFGPYDFVQRISLELAGRSPAQVARAWTGKLVEAIRARDPDHLITVGMQPDQEASMFPAAAVAPLLDLLSVHVYPKTGRVQESLALVQGLASLGKPVLVEETYLLYGDTPTLEQFISASRTSADGWLGFYYGPGVADLKRPSALARPLQREWLRLFEKYAPLLGRTP
jgi:hypothetical protein